MFDVDYSYNEEESQPIARCDECSELIYDNSDKVYMDCEGNYFCCLSCALGYYGIHEAEDCLVRGM